ncbi:MAG TPA: inositol monophosphatase [Desulfobacteraceae bacterium]|nr:inositol monophosphatase [Desulfobacteraceae bacterium]
MDIELVKRTAIAAAYKAGELICSFLGHADIRKKGDIDLVTQADTGSEKIIIDAIRARFPDHAILAEESGQNIGNADFCWIIDPLDGTTNFAHQLPLFSVSIGFSYKGKIAAGVVFNPVSGELFTATQGNGAQLNGRPIQVSGTEKISESLLVSGFPYNFKEIFDPLMMRFSNCMKAAQAVRRLGSASLDLCYVACGRFEGFWEQNLKPWDTAAGLLIAQEAGATVTDFSGNPYTTDQKEILATNGKIHNNMLALLKL